MRRDPTEGTLKIGFVNISASMLVRIHVHIGHEVSKLHYKPLIVTVRFM
jgi:hypothetical protein